MAEVRVPKYRTAFSLRPREQWSIVGSGQCAKGDGKEGRRLYRWGCVTPWFSLSMGTVSLPAFLRAYIWFLSTP